MILLPLITWMRVALNFLLDDSFKNLVLKWREKPNIILNQHGSQHHISILYSFTLKSFTYSLVFLFIKPYSWNIFGKGS